MLCNFYCATGINVQIREEGEVTPAALKEAKDQHRAINEASLWCFFFPPLSLSLLGLRLLFHTSRIKYNQSFHICFFFPLWDVEGVKKNLGYCIGMS